MNDQLQVVAIVNDGRSGSVFLGSLLDNHPNVITTPYAQMGLYYEHFWNDANAPLRERSTLDQLIDTFCFWFLEIFDGRKRQAPYYQFDRLGPDRDRFIYVDQEKFRVGVIRHLAGKPITRRSFFLAVHLAYAEALGQDLRQKTLIVFPFHDPWDDKVKNFHQDFPNARLIVTTRDPRASYASAFKYNLKFWGDLQDAWIYHIVNRPLLPFWTINFALTRGTGINLVAFSRENIRVLRLEDLHLNSRETMDRLVRWLGIPFNPTLLESTCNGLKFWFAGATSKSGEVGGFSPEIAKSRKWATDYYPSDRAVLEYLLRARLSGYHYSVPPGAQRLGTVWLLPSLILLPSKFETRYMLEFFTPTYQLRMARELRRDIGRLGGHVRVFFGPWIPLFIRQAMRPLRTAIRPLRKPLLALAGLLYPALVALIFVRFIYGVARRIALELVHLSGLTSIRQVVYELI